MTIRPLHGATFKVLGIAALALMMLIPLAQVNELVGEREGRAREATQKIAERWGAQQLVAAPVLVVPVRRQVQHDKEWTTVEERMFVLADRASVTGKLAPELRRYGIYETAVYTADLSVEGRFSPADVAALAAPGVEPQWQRAELRVPVADVRGIRRISTLHVGDRELAFGPSGDGVATIAAVSASAPLDAARLGETLPFSFTLTLAGTERFAVLPLARETDLHLSSPWPDPGFDGAFLPASRHVDANGFDADWQVLDLNRRLAQQWRESEAPGALSETSFGITLTQPAGSYQQNVRAGKYGVLFIALTFVAFFLFEVLRGLACASGAVSPGRARALHVLRRAARPVRADRLRGRVRDRGRVRRRDDRRLCGCRARGAARGARARRAGRGDLWAALWARRQRGLRAADGIARAARRRRRADVSHAPRRLVWIDAGRSDALSSVAVCTAGSVMEDDACRAAAPARDSADTVLEVHAMPAARAALGAMMRRDDRRITLPQRDDTRRRLRTWTLLDEHELAAVEIAARLAEQDHRLQRKHMLAVEILMQAVVVACVVAEQQRRRTVLACVAAALQECIQVRREFRAVAEAFGPAVRDRHERFVKLLAQ